MGPEGFHRAAGLLLWQVKDTPFWARSGIPLWACLPSKAFWCCFAVAHFSAIFVSGHSAFGLPASGSPVLAQRGLRRRATPGVSAHRPAAQVAAPKGRLLSGWHTLSTMRAQSAVLLCGCEACGLGHKPKGKLLTSTTKKGPQCLAARPTPAPPPPLTPSA